MIRKIFYRLKKKSVEPGEAYGAPGQGKSFYISVLSTFLIFLLWFLITSPFYDQVVEEEVEVTRADGTSGYVVQEVEVKRSLIDPLFLPAPYAVFHKMIVIWQEEFSGANLLGHIGWSVYRVFSAFFLAMLIAIPVGVLMGVNRFFRGILDPPIEFYRPIPPLAYLPLIIIWFGIDEVAKIVLIFLAIFAPMVLNTRAGVRSVPIEQIHVAYSMGASRFQVITQVILKGALPEILTGMRIGIGFGWTTLVAAELVAAEAGLGAMIKSGADFLVTDVVILGIVIIGLIAYLFDLLMRYGEQKLVPWKGKV